MQYPDPLATNFSEGIPFWVRSPWKWTSKLRFRSDVLLYHPTNQQLWQWHCL